MPDLAESFEPADDAKTWVFKIRKGVTFHNGKTVTADDVVASYRHHMGAGFEVGGQVDADRRHRHQGRRRQGDLHAERRQRRLPLLCQRLSHRRSCRPSDGKVDWQSGIRTGPFKLEKFEPGVSAKMKRNPNYL